MFVEVNLFSFRRGAMLEALQECLFVKFTYIIDIGGKDDQ